MEYLSPIQTKQAIKRVMYNLSRFKKHSERDFGMFKVSTIKVSRVMEIYKSTLLNVRRRYTIEPPSSGFNQGETRYTWNSRTHKSGIGDVVYGTLEGTIRPEFRGLTEAFVASGTSFVSSGGVFCSIPNKSFDRVRGLLENPEFLFPVIRLGMEDLWLDFWSESIPIRYNKTRQMLKLKSQYPNIFSEHNENAGTGASIRGIRAQRYHLDNFDSLTLEPFIRHQAGSAILHAATQLIEPPAGSVWLIKYMNPNVLFSVASRSDVDILDMRFDPKSGTLYQTFEANTRQAGTDVSGLLANAATEAKYFGKSASQEIWEHALNRYSAVEQRPPWADLQNVIDLWTAPTLDTPGPLVLIGQDLGLDEPIKAGADNLFCGAFIQAGKKTMPHLLSGTWYTSIGYVPFHIHFGRKIRKYGATMSALGDDMNILCPREVYDKVVDCLEPYKKIKGTKGKFSKILGFWTDRSLPNRWLISQTPRLVKSVSSAMQVASQWAEIIPKDNGPSGQLSVETPLAIERDIQRQMPVLVSLTSFEGTPGRLQNSIKSAWRGMQHLDPALVPHWVNYHSPSIL